jgi:hypothetical protein
MIVKTFKENALMEPDLSIIEGHDTELDLDELGFLNPGNYLTHEDVESFNKQMENEGLKFKMTKLESSEISHSDSK